MVFTLCSLPTLDGIQVYMVKTGIRTLFVQANGIDDAEDKVTPHLSKDHDECILDISKWVDVLVTKEEDV